MKEAIKKIGLVVFVVLSAVLPQYSEELKSIQLDPEFWNSVVWIFTGVMAWINKAPDVKAVAGKVINKLKKKDVK